MKLSFSVEELQASKEGRGGKYLPNEGRFNVRINDIQITPTRAGNQKMDIFVEAYGGEHAGKLGTERIGLDKNQVSVDKGIWFLKALGFTEQEILDGPETSDMIGRTAQLVRRDPVKTIGTNGKEYTNWKTNWYPIEEAATPNFNETDVDLTR